jgi:hypothetical protein
MDFLSCDHFRFKPEPVQVLTTDEVTGSLRKIKVSIVTRADFRQSRFFLIKCRRAAKVAYYSQHRRSVFIFVFDNDLLLCV